MVYTLLNSPTDTPLHTGIVAPLPYLSCILLTASVNAAVEQSGFKNHYWHETLISSMPVNKISGGCGA